MSELLDKHDYTPKPAKWRIWFNGFVCGILLCLLFWGGSLVLNPGSHKNLVSKNPSLKKVHHYQEYKNRGNTEYTRSFFAGARIQNTFSDTNYRLLNESQPIAASKHNIPNYLNKTIALHYEKRGANDGDNRDGCSVRNNIAPNLAAIEPISTISLSNMSRNEQTLNRPQNRLQKQKKDSKSRKSNWDIAWRKLCLELKASDDMYKNFIGPDRVKVYYSPMLFFGSFKNSNHIGQGAGFSTTGTVTQKISLGIGAAYKTYEWSNRIEFGSLKEQKGTIDTTFTYTIDSLLLQKGNWSYIEIPVHIKLSIIKRSKWGLGAKSEIAAQLFHKESFNQSLIINGISTNTGITQKPFANKTVMGSIGIGLEYEHRLSERWILTAEPYYKWQVSPLGASKYQPRGAGLNLGATYLFNRRNHKK